MASIFLGAFIWPL